MLKRFTSMRSKFFWVTISIALFFILLLITSTSYIFQRSLINHEQNHLDIVARALARELYNGIVTYNTSQVDRTLRQSMIKNLLWTTVYDKFGEPIAHMRNTLVPGQLTGEIIQDLPRDFSIIRQHPKQQLTLETTRNHFPAYMKVYPITAQNDTTVWAYLDVGFSLEHTARMISRFRVIQIILGLISAISAIGVVLFLINRITKPIKRMRQAAVEFASGDYSQRISVNTNDELGDLAWAFNHMAEEVNKSQSRLQQWADRLETEVEKRTRSLQESEEFNRKLIEKSPDGIAVHQDGKLVYINPAGAKLLGYDSAEKLLGKPVLEFVHPDYRDQVKSRIEEMVEGSGETPFTEEKFLKKDGTPIDVEVGASVLHYNGKRAIQVMVRDLSERKKLKEQLLQAQKMESIGRLAGGLAHDFNNILTSISGYVSLMQRKVSPDDPFSRPLETVKNSVHKATDLTNKLLGFARGGKYNPQVVGPVEILDDTANLIRGFLSPQIDVQIDADHADSLIEADQNQIEQCMLNLCLNARDAMPDGGTLKLSVSDFRITKENIERYPLAAHGDYVKFTISDTGKGISQEHKGKIFEPFFTTKRSGEGTGLGLAMVYGIINNHGGTIRVDSEVDKGTTFELLLPATTRPTPHIKRHEPMAQTKIPPDRTILVVDDEPGVLDMFDSVLSDAGCNVLTASSGEDALKLYETQHAEIDVVILDMILPGMSGKEIFEEMHTVDPRVDVIICSGYSQESDVSDLLEKGAIGFLPKPVKFDQLAQFLV